MPIGTRLRPLAKPGETENAKRFPSSMPFGIIKHASGKGGGTPPTSAADWGAGRDDQNWKNYW